MKTFNKYGPLILLIVSIGSTMALMILLTMFVLASRASAAPETWDKSSVKIDGTVCLDGVSVVSVTNLGEAMTGPVEYRWTYFGELPIVDSVQFAAGQTIYFYPPRPGDYPVKFEIDQRPFHPGSSTPELTLEGDVCPETTPTATSTNTAEPTNTATMVPTATATVTPTVILDVPTVTATSTVLPTSTAIYTATATATSVPEPTEVNYDEATGLPTTAEPFWQLFLSAILGG